MIVRIYCLLHPDTKMPFYVGSTRNTLSFRLSGHVSDSKVFSNLNPTTLTHHRHRLIHSLFKKGKKPIIKTLCIVSRVFADRVERGYYDAFVCSGFFLLQSNNRFTGQVKWKEGQKELYRKIRQTINH